MESNNPSILRPGTVIGGGRFSISSVLGEGGFGVTYRAWDTRLQRDVAIKEFFPAGCVRIADTVHPPTVLGASFADIRRRFIGEATTLAQFSHPGIVPVFQVLDELGTAFIVMEYLGGRTLEAEVAEVGPLPPAQVVGIVREIGAALDYVHRRGMLHRDVSPSNVMRFNDRSILIDFGATREFLANQSSDLSQIVKSGYSPLEQYSGHGTVGPPSDIYSLCATAYFLCTGDRPLDVTARISGAELRPIGSDGSSFRGLNAAIDRGLAIRPIDRPQTIDEFFEVLDRPPSPTSAGPTVRLDDDSARGSPAYRVPPTMSAAVPSGPRPRSARKFVVPVAIGLCVLTAAIVGVLLRDAGNASPQQNEADAPAAQQGSASKSSREEKRAAPDVIGAEAESAQATAEQNGLNVTIERTTSISVAKGFVVRQSPAPGVATDRLSIVVSDGPPPAPLPPASGDSASSALPPVSPHQAASSSNVLDLQPGLICRDLLARGFNFVDALDYWVREGTPDRMDKDLNGIPCETVYPADEVAAGWAAFQGK